MFPLQCLTLYLSSGIRLWSLSWLRKVCGFSMQDNSVLLQWKNRSSSSFSRKSSGSIFAQCSSIHPTYLQKRNVQRDCLHCPALHFEITVKLNNNNPCLPLPYGGRQKCERSSLDRTKHEPRSFSLGSGLVFSLFRL